MDTAGAIRPLPPPERAALKRLCKQAPAFRPIERKAGPLHWRVREPGFATLLRAIVGQQVSNAAANAIWRKTEAAFGQVTPEAVAAAPEELFRAIGFSRQKVLYARGLAEAVGSGALDLVAIEALPDDEAVAAISSLKGLGKWTAEVYLLFAHRRQDVFPAADLALAAAAADLLGLEDRPKERAFRVLAEPWRPYRGLAARLLWHHWRYLSGRPAEAD